MLPKEVPVENCLLQPDATSHHPRYTSRINASITRM